MSLHHRLLLLVSVLFLLGGCSLPKIIVYKDPLTPEEHINLGVTYEKQGKYDLAIEQYREAASELDIAYYYLGNAYFKKGKYKEAERCYKKMLSRHPDHADTLNNLAWLYFKTDKNLDTAEMLVRKAIKLNPSRNRIYMDTLENIIKLKGAQ